MKRLLLVLILLAALCVTSQPVAACGGPDCNPPPPPPPGSVAISSTVYCVPVADGHYFYILAGPTIKTSPVISGSC